MMGASRTLISLSNETVHTDARQSIGMIMALCKGHEGGKEW
jgi:hypothetical protein